MYAPKNNSGGTLTILSTDILSQVCHELEVLRINKISRFLVQIQKLFCPASLNLFAQICFISLSGSESLIIVFVCFFNQQRFFGGIHPHRC